MRVNAFSRFSSGSGPQDIWIKATRNFSGGNGASSGNQYSWEAVSYQLSAVSCQFSVLSSQFSVLSSQFSVLSSQFSVLKFGFDDGCRVWFRLRFRVFAGPLRIVTGAGWTSLHPSGVLSLLRSGLRAGLLRLRLRRRATRSALGLEEIRTLLPDDKGRSRRAGRSATTGRLNSGDAP